jgi:glycosyltransferase involved in cell wall biosynthesis
MPLNDDILRLLVLAHANRTAGPRYVAMNLIRALAGLDSVVQITPVLPVGCGFEKVVEACNLTPIWFDQRKNRLRRFLFDTVSLPSLVRHRQPDAVLSLGSSGLLGIRVPQAILIQDPHFVYPRRYYGNMSFMEHVRYAVQRRALRLALARSSLVYGQTPLMLERIACTFPLRGQLKILPKCTAPAGEVASPARTGTFAEALNSHHGRFRLICVCRYYAHKNLEIICDAFEQWGDLLGDTTVFLTIAASQHPHARTLLNRMASKNLLSRIVNLGPLSQGDLAYCLANCDGLLLPTKLESFSGAYLDAMQYGLPILTSDLDFAHHVCGEAAIYFDPFSPKSLAEAIVALKSDASLRQQLAEAGRGRLGRVYSQSWEEVAAAVVSDLGSCVRDAITQV